MVRALFSTATQEQVWVAYNGTETRRFSSVTELKDHFVKAYPGNHVQWEESAGSDGTGKEIDLDLPSRQAQISHLKGARFMSKLIRCDAATLSGQYHPRDWWYHTGWYAWREQ